jgi:guanyl-specific ribonuclease Sa
LNKIKNMAIEFAHSPSTSNIGQAQIANPESAPLESVSCSEIVELRGEKSYTDRSSVDAKFSAKELLPNQASIFVNRVSNGGLSYGSIKQETNSVEDLKL